MNKRAAGRLVILSGPSGAGKTTVVNRLLETTPLPLKLSISATTRSPRPGEQSGVEYHFLTKDTFQRRCEANEFLEWKEVFGRGDLYGTLRSETESRLAAGDWVLLEIDVEGAMMVLEQHPDAITLFVHPGSMDELERRLRARGTEDEGSITRRLEVATREMASRKRYKHEVINDTVPRAVEEICEILMSYVGDESSCWKN